MAVRSKLRQLHRVGERKLRNSAAPTCLGANVARLSRLVGLSDTDCRILEFTVLIHTERLLDDAGDFLGQLAVLDVERHGFITLDVVQQEVVQLLDFVFGQWRES